MHVYEFVKFYLHNSICFKFHLFVHRIVYTGFLLHIFSSPLYFIEYFLNVPNFISFTVYHVLKINIKGTYFRFHQKKWINSVHLLFCLVCSDRMVGNFYDPNNSIPQKLECLKNLISNVSFPHREFLHSRLCGILVAWATLGIENSQTNKQTNKQTHRKIWSCMVPYGQILFRMVPYDLFNYSLISKTKVLKKFKLPSFYPNPPRRGGLKNEKLEDVLQERKETCFCE